MATEEEHRVAPPARSFPVVAQVLVVLVVAGIGGLAALLTHARSAQGTTPVQAPAVVAPKADGGFVPTQAQLATFTIQEVKEQSFQVEHATEGKISVNEDRATPIFSPYGGRVIRLMAKAGDIVAAGQILFTLEATDMVQAQNDLIVASGVINKARSQLGLAVIIEKRQRDLNDARAVALKELQTAQNELVAAQNDLKAAETAFEAVKNRLRILGKTDAEIDAFLKSGKMSPETPIYSPIAGTVTQRKIGPGQYIATGATEPAFTIGDLSYVWLIASVRESVAPRIAVGQTASFSVLAFPDRQFQAKLTYVASSVDPATRRVQVRGEVDNREGLLKPEMFASVRIAIGDSQMSAAVPREAVIYEGDQARVWVVGEGNEVSLRRVKTGMVNAGMLQITSGLKVGERVVTRGSLFIDRLASSGDSP